MKKRRAPTPGARAEPDTKSTQYILSKLAKIDAQEKELA
jgi:hypothetical protein